MKVIPYHFHYPSAGRGLIDDDITAPPKQIPKELKWAEGIDITYTLRGLTPANFQKYSDQLLLLAYQEGMRYKGPGILVFASFDVRFGKIPKRKDVEDIVTFQAATHGDPEIMVYGPGYEVPQKYFLTDKVEAILDTGKGKHPSEAGKINTQVPYRVVKLRISIREPRPR